MAMTVNTILMWKCSIHSKNTAHTARCQCYLAVDYMYGYSLTLFSTVRASVSKSAKLLLRIKNPTLQSLCLTIDWLIKATYFNYCHFLSNNSTKSTKKAALKITFQRPAVSQQNFHFIPSFDQLNMARCNLCSPPSLKIKCILECELHVKGPKLPWIEKWPYEFQSLHQTVC